MSQKIRELPGRMLAHRRAGVVSARDRFRREAYLRGCVYEDSSPCGTESLEAMTPA